MSASDSTEWSVSTDVPAQRREALERVRAALLDARRIVLTTHVNADGDGAGSEAALAAWLSTRGRTATIVNPTPYPAPFRFLIRDPSRVADAGTSEAARALDQADLLAVLDTGEPRRIGRVASALKRLPVVLLDHHPAGERAIGGVQLTDTEAAATGELVYDLLRLEEEIAGEDEMWPVETLEGLYTAIVTDTGSFRFSNTTPRTHAIVGDLLRRGVDPERMFRLIYGTVPVHRVRLLCRALSGLEVDPSLPLAWITVPTGAVEELGASSDDLDGIIEHARSIEGMQVALLFRQTADGSTKVSFRSNGELDVNTLARAFGGGGHVKAAGALIPEPLEVARERVLDATRDAVRELVASDHPG